MTNSFLLAGATEEDKRFEDQRVEVGSGVPDSGSILIHLAAVKDGMPLEPEVGAANDSRGCVIQRLRTNSRRNEDFYSHTVARLCGRAGRGGSWCGQRLTRLWTA